MEWAGDCSCYILCLAFSERQVQSGKDTSVMPEKYVPHELPKYKLHDHGPRT